MRFPAPTVCVEIPSANKFLSRSPLPPSIPPLALGTRRAAVLLVTLRRARALTRAGGILCIKPTTESWRAIWCGKNGWDGIISPLDRAMDRSPGSVGRSIWLTGTGLNQGKIKGLYKAGGMRQTTMRNIDALCIPQARGHAKGQIQRHHQNNAATNTNLTLHR